MIFWNEYKKFKLVAQYFVDTGVTSNLDIQVQLDRLYEGNQNEEKTIENIINILSNGDHFAPLHNFKKIGEQQKLNL